MHRRQDFPLWCKSMSGKNFSWCWWYNIICDRIWENPAYSKFYEFLVSYIFDKLYHRANLPPSFRPIAHFAWELERFVCDCATPTIIKEITVQRRYYARVWCFRILRVNQKSIKWTWAEPFELNVKIEQGSNFVIDNDSQLFFDAKEAKKVSECTVVQWI